MSAGACFGQAGGAAGWGSNISGECNAPDVTFTKVAAGRHFSFGITAGGEILHWGTNLNGVNQVPSGGTFVQVEAGYDHGLALRANGTLAAWGGVNSAMYPPGTQGTVPPDPAGSNIKYTAVSAGECFNLALRENGSVFGWGWDDRGQWTTIPDNNPSASDFVPYISINAGGHHGVGLKANGTARAWGGTLYGSGTQGQVPPGLTDQPFLSVGAGHYESYLIKPDRSLVQWGGWGCNGTPPANIKWAVLDGGYKHGYGLSTKGKVYAWMNPTCDSSNYQPEIVPSWLQDATVSVISPGQSNWHTIVIIP